MQEEVTRGAVTLIVDGAKLSEQVFEKAVKKFLEEIQKSQKPKIYRGRQSLTMRQSTTFGKCRGAVTGNCHSATFRRWRWTSSAL